MVASRYLHSAKEERHEFRQLAVGASRKFIL